MKTIALILTVLLVGCNLAIAQSPYATRLPAELQTAQMDSLADVTWLQGTTPAIRVEPLLRGRSVAVDADTTVRMVIGPSATGTLYAARTNLAAVTNAYEIQWPTIGTNSAGEAWFYTLLFDRGGYTYWSGSGSLYIEETTSTASNGLAWIEYTTPNVGWANVVGDPADNAALVQYVEDHGGGSAEDTVARAAAAGVESNLTAHVADTDNPHGVTAGQIGALTAESDPAWTAASGSVVYATTPGYTAAVEQAATSYGWGDHAEEGYLEDAPETGGPFARQSNGWVAVTVGSGGLSLEELQALFVSSSNDNFTVENGVGGFRIGFHGTNAFRVLAQTTAVARITSFSAGTSNLTFRFESPSGSNILWWTEIITPETVASLEWSVYTGEVSFSWSSGIGTATVASVDLTEPRLWRIASDGLAVASNAYARFDVPAYVGDERIATMADLSIASAGSLLYASVIASDKVPLDYSVPVTTNEMIPPSEYIPAWSFDLDTGTATVHRLRVGSLADTNGNPVSVGDGINSATAGEIATNVLSTATTNDMPGVDWGSLVGGGGTASVGVEGDVLTYAFATNIALLASTNLWPQRILEITNDFTLQVPTMADTNAAGIIWLIVPPISTHTATIPTSSPAILGYVPSLATNAQSSLFIFWDGEGWRMRRIR